MGALIDPRIYITPGADPRMYNRAGPPQSLAEHTLDSPHELLDGPPDGPSNGLPNTPPDGHPD